MLYVGFGYIPVLAIHSIFVIVTYVQDPLFQIHLFKRKDVGKLARPFGSSAVFHTDAKVKEVNSKDEMTMALKNAGSKVTRNRAQTEQKHSCFLFASVPRTNFSTISWPGTAQCDRVVANAICD